MNFSVIYNAMIKEAGKAQKAARNASRIQNAVQHADALIAKFTKNPVKGVSLQDLQHLRSQLSTANKGNIGELEKALAKMEKVIGKAADVTKSVDPAKGAGDAVKATTKATEKATKATTKAGPIPAKDLKNLQNREAQHMGRNLKIDSEATSVLDDLGSRNGGALEGLSASERALYDSMLGRQEAAANNLGKIKTPEQQAATASRYSSFSKQKRNTAAKDVAKEVALDTALGGTILGTGYAVGAANSEPSPSNAQPTDTAAVNTTNAEVKTEEPKGILNQAKAYAKQYQPELIGAGAGLAGAGGLYALGGAIPALKKKKLLRAITALAGGAGIGYGAYALSQPKTASYKEFKNSIKRG